MISIVAAIVVLGLLIIVHELGHFAVAKITGVGVERFSIGFGPRLFGKTIGETEYCLSAFPLGGYVKMVGENPDKDEEKELDPDKSFMAKNVRTRMAVVSAGPISNLVLAILIFSLVFMWGVPVLLSTVGEVRPDSPAMKAGFITGDRIIMIDELPVETWEDMTAIIHGSAGIRLSIVVNRGGRELTFQVTPESTVVKNIFGEDATIGLVGISQSDDTVIKRFSPLTAVGMAVNRTWDIIRLTFIGIGKIFQRVVPASTLGGPIMIVQLAGSSAKTGLQNLLFLTAFLSVSLGVFNLLPIPILDGGHLFFFIIEGIRKRPISMRKREIVQQIGLFILISIFLFVSYNDIMRLASKLFTE